MLTTDTTCASFSLDMWQCGTNQVELPPNEVLWGTLASAKFQVYENWSKGPCAHILGESSLSSLQHVVIFLHLVHGKEQNLIK
jgi:hypothetical protein